MKNRMLPLALIPLLSLATITIIEAKSKTSSSASQSNASAMQQPAQSAATQSTVQQKLQQYKTCPQGDVVVVKNSHSAAIGSFPECVSIKQIAKNLKAKAPDLILGTCAQAPQIRHAQCNQINCGKFHYHVYTNLDEPISIYYPECPTLSAAAEKAQTYIENMENGSTVPHDKF